MDTLPEELFARSIMLYGREGFARLQRSSVTVVGLGGVGSYAAEALVRAGVGRLRIIDCDVVKATDVNRQLFALTTTVGRPKTEAARERLLAVNPHLNLDARNAFFHSDTASDLITDDLDFVVDAIDSLNPKVELIRFCVETGRPLISAMGAAGRTDPSRITVARLDDTKNCPLARAVRRTLKRKGIGTDIPVVYSGEPPLRGRPDASGGSTETSGTYLRGRHRQSLPSLSTIPAIFGLFTAGYVLKRLLA
jgi:tRNA threonylcarbamoyladenosine dehydratase